MTEEKRDRHKLQCVIVLPEKMTLEDDFYEVKYLIKNISNIDFLDGYFGCMVMIPELGDVLKYTHIWRSVGRIRAGETKPLIPKKIKAVRGPHVFIFNNLYPVSQNEDFMLVDENGDEIEEGSNLGDLRVRSLEEISSTKSLRIAADSLIILIGVQLFNWGIQLWDSKIICTQFLVYIGLVLLFLMGLIIFLTRRSNNILQWYM